MIKVPEVITEPRLENYPNDGRFDAAMQEAAKRIFFMFELDKCEVARRFANWYKVWKYMARRKMNKVEELKSRAVILQVAVKYATEHPEIALPVSSWRIELNDIELELAQLEKEAK